MSEIKNYKIEFVKRTIELLNDNFGDFNTKDKEVTFLLNCLLGLIVTVSENEKKSRRSLKGNIDPIFSSYIPDKIGFHIKGQNIADLTEISLTDIKTKVGHKTDLTSYEKMWFVNKLRNGIAHQNIEGINENGLWIGFRLWNNNNEEVKNFEIIFTIEEIRKLAVKIAEDFLESV